MSDHAPTLDEFVSDLFPRPDMLLMGHGQRLEDHDLGLAWRYYAPGRMLRPARAVVIGSYRGFVPGVIALALLDNQEGSEIHFVDPSLADDFWSDPGEVASHFEGLGSPNIRHHRHTTQSFVETESYTGLDAVGLFMVDGLHTAQQAGFNYQRFLPKLTPDAVTLFHDNTIPRASMFYGDDRAYEHSVYDLMERIRADAGLELFTLPVAGGLSMVRGQPADPETLFAPFPEAGTQT